jgi:DNA modification methylase
MASSLTKNIYFPLDKTEADESRRLELDFELDGHSSAQSNFLSYVQRLSSRQIRYIIGDPTWESLNDEAEEEGLDPSGLASRKLKEHFDGLGEVSNGAGPQMSLFDSEVDASATSYSGGDSELGVTYRDTKSLPVHRWYPYIEGFSADYVRDRILNCDPLPRTVYDPFGGCGTTMLEASRLRIQSFFSEVNPFMRFVAETKINGSRWVKENEEQFQEIADAFLERLERDDFKREAESISLSEYHSTFPDRDYFEEKHLRELLLVKRIAKDVAGEWQEAEDILLLCVAAQTVPSSKMTRRADLRRRREDEYKDRVVDVPLMVRQHFKKIMKDISNIKRGVAETKFLNYDVREAVEGYNESVDLAITSPPYLNGTNYFRNTKLELWILGYLEDEDELKEYRDQALAAGINNVAKRRGEPTLFDFVEEVATELDEEANDKRIPRLIRLYFSNMSNVLSNVHGLLRNGGKFLIDVGDSKFYGVHVPTDTLLCKLAKREGFEVDSRNIIAKRRSRDSTPLHQAEIVLKKPGNNIYSMSRNRKKVKESPVVERENERIRKDASWLEENLPYKSEPYSKRGWGHKLHSLCSYQGKLKPAIAHWLVKAFTGKSDIVLDPLGGVGTIAFEAALQGRPAISNDLSPLASTVAGGKIRPPSKQKAYQSLQKLESHLQEVDLASEDFEAAEFGLNDSVKNYYHEKTLREVLKARKYFYRRDGLSDGMRFVKASILHILHGNRPYALSRSSHPVTPFKPSGDYEYRPLIDRIKNRLEIALKKPLPEEFVKGKSLFGNYKELENKIVERVDCVITSPPFIGMRFDRPNWLRLWFCGWGEDDFHETSKKFLERKQKDSLNVYEEFFDSCGSLLRKNGLMILHVGDSDEHEMVNRLKEIGSSKMTFITMISENVQGVESHGIEDKGLTSDHNFLFFRG